MSQEINEQAPNKLVITTDTSRIFLRGNRYEDGIYTNSTYDPVSLAVGRLMGRISATQKLVPHVSTAVDGSQYPVGILATDYLVDDGDSQTISICVAGEVAKEKVTLGGSDTMATVISGRSILDRIGADTVGIKLVVTNENTIQENI